MHRVILAAGRESNYVRNYLMLQALNAFSKVTPIMPTQPGSLSRNLLSILFRLIPALRRPHNLVILGFYSYPLVPIVRRLTAAPILFDAFVSTWDTLCFDRARFPPDSSRGQMVYRLDSLACQSADRVLLDTRTHAQYFSETFDLPIDKVSHWYVGCDETIFQPKTDTNRAAGEPISILFYGTYQPLHGVDIIVRSAALLQNIPTLRFVLVGEGQTFEQAREIAHHQQLANIDFRVSIPLKELAALIAQSDICLAGPFGNTPKARRVIPGKTAQFLAMARPVIAGDSPAIKEILVHGKSAYLCQQADPSALANAILHLAREPSLRSSLAQRGRQLFEERLSLSRLTADLASIIDSMHYSTARRAASSRSTHTSH